MPRFIISLLAFLAMSLAAFHSARANDEPAPAAKKAPAQSTESGMILALPGTFSDAAQKTAKPKPAADESADEKSPTGKPGDAEHNEVEGPVRDMPAAKAKSPDDEPAEPAAEKPAKPGIATIRSDDNAKPTKPQKTDKPAKPAEKPAAKEAVKPAVEPAVKPVEKPAQKPAEKTEAKEEKTAAPAKRVPQFEMTEPLAAIRDRIRWALKVYAKESFNTRDNTATDVLRLCTAYGCQTEIVQGDQEINGITCLCWNYPCAGFELLRPMGDHIGARVGFGMQERPAQFLAMLALSRVPSDYPVRAGRLTRTVADLVECEKLQCREGSDQSLRLLGLANYVPAKATWSNELGETWSIERLTEDELGRSLVGAPFGGTQRLLALSYAVVRQKNPTSDVNVRVDKFLREYREFAYKLQNADGSWHPMYFAAKGPSHDQISQFIATAHVAQWLVISHPESSLNDPRLVRAVENLSDVLIQQSSRWSLPALSDRLMDGMTTALCALTLYDERAFQPFNEQEAEKAKKEAAEKEAAAKEADEAKEKPADSSEQ